ncbi:MAG: HmuY family protein [Bacteroidota bacterium]
MKKYPFYLLALLASAFLFTACGGDDDNEDVQPDEPLEVILVEDIPADPITGVDPNTGRPIGDGVPSYVRLSDQALVSESDNWDVAFQSTSIYVNGGAIRSGDGGGYIYTGTFESLTEIPATQAFGQDHSESELAIPTGSGNGWYNYNPQINVVTPISGRVVVIRTADGKFAKIEVLSYYKGNPAEPTSSDQSRHYTFRMVYQPDGSRSFE